MHVHVSALDFIVVALYVIIFGALWRWGSSTLAANDNPLAQTFGKSMAVIF